MYEKNAVLGSLKERARRIPETFHSIDGLKCNEVMGAMYAFPQTNIPQAAIEKAKVVECNLKPFRFWSSLNKCNIKIRWRLMVK